jgi:signal transduction histidine kinase
MLKPLPINEENRIAALKSYDILDSGEEKDFDDLTSLASVICQIPIALITFITEDRQWFKSHHGTEFTENLRALSFCTHALASNEDVTIVPDATRDQRFANNPLVTGPTKVAFYAGVPLINEDGFALGTLCVLDQRQRVLSTDQVTALKTLAKQVVDKIELRRKVLKLEKVNQELLNSNVLIQKFASMAAHDIKNPLSSMLLTSQALKIRHEKAQDEASLRLVDININATKSLLRLVSEMLEYSKTPSLLIAKKSKFEFNSFVKKICSLLIIPENIEINLPPENNELYGSAIAMEQMLINLLSNAIRYNDKDKGIINIKFKEEPEDYVLEVEDNGIGISQEYFEKIFENNFSLKVTDRYNETGSGIGLSTVKDLVSLLNGTIRVTSVVGNGTTFYLRLKK